jgi:hypothetical protein
MPWVQFDEFMRQREQTFDTLPVTIEEPRAEPEPKEQKPPWHMRARSDGSCPKRHTHQPQQPSKRCVCFCTYCRGEP